MNAAEKIAHAAERKAFETMLDSLIRKSQTKDVCTVANDFVNMVQKIHSSVWTPETFEMLHQIANDPDSKWAHYAERLLRECDPYLLRTFLTAAAYEGGFRGFQQARANSEKYDCNIPWIVLMDPTSACNMRCAGCWAAEYGHKQNLTFEEMDRVLTEGAELGTHACLFTGGEPLMRKADIFRLCEKHRDIAFHAFTNGTLIDQAFCDELKRVGNFIVSVSIEGFEDANDGRRGAGHFEKALAAMELMQAKVEKNLRNTINRQVNCETANMMKAADASARQIAAIQALIDSRGEDAFPGNLWETVRLRLEYPTDSLSELAQRFDPPISKPGLSHRLKKIIELAEKED